MTEKNAKWIMFAVMAGTVPTYFFLFVTGGLFPLVAYYILVVPMFIGHWFFGSVVLINCLAYTAIIYFAARIFSVFTRHMSKNKRTRFVLVLSLTLILLSILPIYGGGHNSMEYGNLFQSLEGAWYMVTQIIGGSRV